jgi:hypothetical protein
MVEIDEGKRKDEEGKDKGDESKEVSIPEETYTSLMDRIAELEDAVESKKKVEEKRIYNIDELAEEGQRRKVASRELEEVDWDKLSNKEMVGKLGEMINKGAMDIRTEIETLKVLREIDHCAGKYEDFWEYEEDIRAIAAENPSLSIEKAYRLAKVEKGDRGKGREKTKEGEEELEERKGERTRTKTERLLNLPKVFGGERPGLAKSTTTASRVISLKDAADRAWDEVAKGKETLD